ncbi:hypothetical protein D3C80_1524640 [compost metagenome]
MVDAALGADVGGIVLDHRAGGRRADLDDRAALLHAFDHGLQELEGALELQGDHPLQLLLAGFQEALGQPPAHGVDRNVQAPAPLLGMSHQRPQVTLAGDIAGQAGAAEFIGQARHLLLVAPGNHQARTLLSETAGDFLAHVVPAVGANDQRNLVLKSVHQMVPPAMALLSLLRE